VPEPISSVVVTVGGFMGMIVMPMSVVVVTVLVAVACGRSPVGGDQDVGAFLEALDAMGCLRRDRIPVARPERDNAPLKVDLELAGDLVGRLFEVVTVVVRGDAGLEEDLVDVQCRACRDDALPDPGTDRPQWLVASDGDERANDWLLSSPPAEPVRR
jgi:hypothetical protein